MRFFFPESLIMKKMEKARRHNSRIVAIITTILLILILMQITYMMKTLHLRNWNNDNKVFLNTNWSFYSVELITERQPKVFGNYRRFNMSCCNESLADIWGENVEKNFLLVLILLWKNICISLSNYNNIIHNIDRSIFLCSSQLRDILEILYSTRSIKI